MTEASVAISAERFAALAAAYGAAMENWPAPERSAAHSFALTPQGRHVLDQAVRLDLALRCIGGHGSIRTGSAAQEPTGAPAIQPLPATAGPRHERATPVRRSRSDKLKALSSGGRHHA